jgi:hypothetical protein
MYIPTALKPNFARTNNIGECCKKKSIIGFASVAKPLFTQNKVAVRSIRIRTARK